MNRGIHEKGSRDVVSSVYYTKYTIYLSLCTQTAETTSPEPFSLVPVFSSNQINQSETDKTLKQTIKKDNK